MQDHEILLYYKYTDIDEPEGFAKAHKQLCQELGLKGRIIVADEGLNGTLEGTTDNTQKYVEILLSDPRFEHTHIKRSAGNGQAFPKLSVKVRSEIVSSYLPKGTIDPRQYTAKHISAQELHNLFESGQEFYIVDMRNDYEHKVGHFANSIMPNMANFRDLPETLKSMEHLKDKKIVTVCTGGVRCEKAAAYLIHEGFSDVAQLFGGIVTYMEQYPNQNFLGKLYVFDSRFVMGFNTSSPEHIVVGTCDKCSNKSDHYYDCAYLHCNKPSRHFISCDSCLIDGRAFCSDDCAQKATDEQAFYENL